ncbi:hypothetical protein ACFFU1_17465 [Algibacter miyuki]|uniref:DUF2116 family Zn-ribbon domain-containing protein n=1 Tax=Algibacter miyuki TaxID=1306933 RepID=A0ABV5H5Z4_9FLAO|nr:hypothetical protein [Algibacter miyuki]MDN3665742.1 hypothetical protein [Algibacter miyuki]
MKLKKNECLSCGKELIGRSDKIYCDLHCKSSYHYRKSLDEVPRFYNKVDNQLKLNRKILKNFNKSGKAIVRAKVILDLGFNPKYFTHYWKNKKGDVYLFVFEFGFLKRIENHTEKYILIKWQEYME